MVNVRLLGFFGLAFWLVILSAENAFSGHIRIISTSSQGVEVEIEETNYALQRVKVGDRMLDKVDLPGGVILNKPGYPEVPTIPFLLGVPFGVEVSVKMIEADYEEVEGVNLIPVPEALFVGREDFQTAQLHYLRNGEVYEQDKFFPTQQAILTRTGVMRDQRVIAVSLRPVQYNSMRKTLRVANRLRARIQFSQRGVSRPVVLPPGEGENSPFEPVYHRTLLNAKQAQEWRGRLGRLGKVLESWYDPTMVYYKVRVREDGIYRMDSTWFLDSGINLMAGDLSRIKMFLNGEEIPLEIRDGGDGKLDGRDGIFFYGRYRREPGRDHESQFGREQVYWLTLDGALGRRFSLADGSVRRGFPQVLFFMNRVHVEVDSIYEALGNAQDDKRDHWFWRRTASPSSVGGQEFPANVEVLLPGLDRTVGETGLVRVGMHGLTLRDEIDLDHRTVVSLGGGKLVTEDRWDGQIAYLAEGEVPVSELRDTTRVTLATPGSQEFPLDPVPYVDHVLLNWVEISYPRRFEAVNGSLLFDLGMKEGGSTISISGFQTPEVSVYDLERGQILKGIETSFNGVSFEAKFEVSLSGGPFLAVETEEIPRANLAQLDVSSDLRGERVGSDCVIVTHTRFLEAAERLADHRRLGGLSVQVVDVVDLYDEFAFGQLDPQAVRRFVKNSFQTWDLRPSYLVLFGKAAFDYRDLFGEAQFDRRNFVPALPFQAIRRGLAFTDHLFGSVVGEDLFPDLFVGRLSVSREQEADRVVQKVIGYDLTQPSFWQDRILYLANFDADSIFTQPSNELGTKYAELLGITSYKIYNSLDTPPEPNEDSREMIRQINEGRLVVNYLGHGSVSSMAFFLRGTFQQQNFNYMSQIVNRDRLPLMIAMSCLNGLYADPRFICLAEEMVNKEDGGAIAYISASSLALIFSNNFINTAMFRYFFKDGILQFGQSLALAKIDLLTAFPGLSTSALGMTLIGDPAQELRVPTGPDFSLSEDGLQVDNLGELVTGDSTRIKIKIENQGILPEKKLKVVLVDRKLDQTGTDTLFSGMFLPFGQVDSLVVLWKLMGEGGRHRLELLLDPENKIEEVDEGNNRRELEVEVLGAMAAVPIIPEENQVVPTSGVRLGIRSNTPVEGEVIGEFELSREIEFPSREVIHSGEVGGEAGLVIWIPLELVGEETYFWRGRLTKGDEWGAWTQPRGFVVAASVPERELIWEQQGVEAFRQGTLQDVVLLQDRTIRRVQEPPPLRFNAKTQEAAVSASRVLGTAVLCTDGTYLYVKRFHTSPPIYPGTDRFERIGTGFRGTVRGQNYGILSEVMVRGISATIHGDGFLYAEDGKARDLVRISPKTGAVDRVKVPDGLLEVQTGLVFDGPSLITSDGTYIYNVSSGVNGIRRAGWSVRVFDPEDDWRLLREFEVEPTSTGFGYLFTDGILADGRFLYLIEYGTGLTHRVRVVDSKDGRFVEEFETDQGETGILGGQYDWVNNRVWLGQLKGPMIYLYPGRSLPNFGLVTSPTIGPASSWGQLKTMVLPGALAARAEVNILGENVSGKFLPLVEWSGLVAGSEIDLSKLKGGVNRIRLQARLFGDGMNPSPGLASWSIRYQPITDLDLSNLRSEPKVVKEGQNVKLDVNVLNRGPLELVLGSVLSFYSGSVEGGQFIGRMAVPETTPLGKVRTISMVWNTSKFPGKHLVRVRLENLRESQTFYDRQIISTGLVEVIPSEDRAAPFIELIAQDAVGEVRFDDYLPAEPNFQVIARDSSGIDLESVQLLLTGSQGEVSEDFSSNRLRDVEHNQTSISFLYGPAKLEDGRYVLTVSVNDKMGNGPAKKLLAFQVSSKLQIEKILAVPNPMVTTMAFTYILSRSAEVTIRIYTVSGRLIRMLVHTFGRAGFNQVNWDGLDEDGYRLSNGTYLYTVTAKNKEDQVRVKERFIVYR